MMTQYWWKDLFDRNNNWQGLELTLKSSQRTDVAMEMLSGRYGRMALQVSGEDIILGIDVERPFRSLVGV